MTAEIRRNDDGTVDEVVATQPQSVQLEQMDDDQWFLDITLEDGQRISVRLYTTHGARIHALAEWNT